MKKFYCYSYAKMWKTLWFLFLCLILVQGNSNPFRNPNICGRPTCAIDNPKFKYNPNFQHTYKYNVEIRSLFNGTSENESTLSFETTVQLSFLTECEGILKFQDSILTEGGSTSPNTDDFSYDLRKFTLRFSFQDGLITELCPNPDERTWVLNLKRGLLSMIHSSMKRFDLDGEFLEHDVKGGCLTKYQVIGTEGTSLIIEKTKDLSSCTSRSKLHSVVQSVPYSFRSKIRPENSLLNSISQCVLSIDNNLYKSIKCKESHLLKPFSNRGSGVTTLINQDLILLKSEEVLVIAESEEITKRTTLIYDHTHEKSLTTDNVEKSRSLLLKMCQMDSDDDHIKFSDVFTELISSLRLLTPQALSEIYDDSATLCPSGKQNILYALPYIGTTGAFSLMKNIIIKYEKFDSDTKNDWMFLISLTRYPDQEMMTSAFDLLKNIPFTPSVILSVGALTHTFCVQNSTCDVQNITNHFEENIVELYKNGTDSRENHEKIVVYLKALGNSGQITSSFEKNLYDIIEDENLEMEIRLAAIECHRRIPCRSSRDYFEQLFRNFDEDSELRIASYLQIMKCPNYLLIRTIRHTLENEEVNQVGSFVWSHLNNLLKSAVPSRVEIQGLLSDKDLIKKFSNDLRKFSHNYEGSLFFEEYNIGGSYDSNLIFSTNSYIPSTVSLNMTVDLFGESINLFEVSGRIEGFENYFESMFGPKGPYSYEKLQDKIPKIRFARNTDGDEVLKKQLESIPNVMDKKPEEPKVSLGFRFFGNDLKYTTYNGYDEIKEAMVHLNPVNYLKKILSSREIHYHKAVMFLDSTYSIPSGAGLPISLSSVGTSSLNMIFFGTLKADNFMKTKELEVKADIKPTLSLDITGSLSVDAFYAKTGLKIKTNVYSSTAFEGYLNIKGLKLTKLKISIPQQKSEIFNSKSELSILKHGKEELQTGLKQYTITRSLCSWPVLDKTLGLRTCMEYNFVNVTKMKNAPYFILAGPAGIRIFLEKLDPNAKDFYFEYKWTDNADTSAISLTFDAPGSSLGRIVGANFTIDRQSRNLTLLIKTTAGTVLAKGKYKNSPDEKFLQLSININDFKHFDTSISLTRVTINNGFMYHPKFYIGVNNERVVEIQGTVKLMSKKGVSQYDVDMKFQTKRVTSKLFGYISKTQASIATQLRMLYKFPNSPEQGVDIAFSIANRSKRNLMDIQGTASLESTSYPQYDFESKLKLLRGHAHTEATFNVTFNHKDEPLKWTNFGVSLNDKSQEDATRTFQAIVYFSKPSKNIDVNANFKYYSKAPNTHVALVVDYGKNKQFSSIASWHYNRRPLLDFRLELNVTVPTFHPMLANFKLQEKLQSHYNVDFNGTWFSSHSISAHGFYFDKSTTRNYDHHLKLLVKSPSFQEVICNLQYYRDMKELRVNLKFDQNDNEYSILIKHLNASPKESSSLAKIKYENRIYSLLATTYSGDHQRITAELHIDQMRDIQFAAYAHNKETYKAAGIELKWDANRDPNQKLVLSGNFTKVASFNYLSNLLVSYPGRTLLGNYEFVLRRGHLNSLLRFSWDDEQSFALIVSSDYNFDKKMFFVATSEVVTPFANWKRTFFDANFEHDLNMYSLNGSLKWEKNQHVSLDFFGNYTVMDQYLDCEYRSALSSTLQNIPSLSASIAHTQSESKIDTFAKLQYAPGEVIDVKSKWEAVFDEKTKNYTGTVVTNTPFSGFNKGFLISKIMITDDKYMRGVADLDFDFKKFSISAEGRFKKLTNSMLTVNITTPIEKYSTISGKFGFVEDERYLVALLEYPSKILGVEILLSVQSLTEFDTKFIVGTPLDVVQRIILVGKLKPENADFRAGWNSLLGGFTGKWHYVNTVDFEYSYIIYTPIENFEENSVILKLILRTGVDLDMSIKLSSQKLGFKLCGEKKPALLRDLGIKLDDVYGRKFNEKDGQYDDDDLLSWSGLVEIDTLLYSTMKGSLDIDRKGPVYTVKSKLTVPDGVAIMNDRLEYYHVLSMKNKLEIETPYTSFSKIESSYEIDVAPGRNYILNLNLNYRNSSELIKNEIMAGYLIISEENLSKTHNLTFHTETALVTFLNIDAGGLLTILKKELNRYYMGKIYLNSGKIDVATKGELKFLTEMVDADIYLHAQTGLIRVPPVFLKYKRQAHFSNNSIDVYLHVPEKFKSQIDIHTDWSYISLRDFNVYLNVKTPFEAFEKSVVGVEVTSKNDAQVNNIIIDINPIEAVINNTFKNDVFNSNALLKISGKNIPVFIECNIIKTAPLTRTLNGVISISEKKLDITGNVDVINEFPMGVHIEIIPKETKSSESIILDYKITNDDNSVYKITGSARRAQAFITIDANSNVRSVTDWDADAKIDTSHKEYDHFTLKTTFNDKENMKTFTCEAQTPIENLETAKLDIILVQNPDANKLQVSLKAPTRNGKIDLKWLWIYLENMNIDLKSDLKTLGSNESLSLAGFYINPKKEFQYVRFGGDVDFNGKWSAGSNLTLTLPSIQNITLNANLKLPPPKTEVHTVKGKLFFVTPLKKHLEYLAKYNTLISNKNYGSDGMFTYEEEKQAINGNLAVEWAPKKRLNNIIEYKEIDELHNIVYKLSTPKYKDEHAIVLKGSYKGSEYYHNVTCQVFKPETKSIGFGRIHFSELANMNGLINVTVPYENINYAGVGFTTETSSTAYNRYLEAFWSKNSAKIDAKCDIETGETLLHRTRKGSVLIQVPLHTNHRAYVDYIYKELPLHSLGNATVDYNGNRILDGLYNCLSESRAGFDKDDIHVELLNKLFPIGADYRHIYEYEAPTEEHVFPSKDTKIVSLYHLSNRTRFAIESDLTFSITPTGQQIGLQVKHRNKTVKLVSDYDIFDQEYKQHTRFVLSPEIWLEYNISLFNETINDDYDSQKVKLDLQYPRRNFTVVGLYKISDESASTNVALDWGSVDKSVENSNPRKYVEAGLDWRKKTDKHEQLLFTLKHPSFTKDVTLLSEYDYGGRKIIDARMKLEYAEDPEQIFVMGGRLDDQSTDESYNYTYRIYATHNATNLDLHGNGDVFWSSDVYTTNHLKEYKRSYLPPQTSEAVIRIDLLQNEMELKKEAAGEMSYFKAKYKADHPIYTGNVSIIYDFNEAGGDYYLNLMEKLVRLDYNMTEDGKQSMHMYGDIPDARSAKFNAWRDYEDIRISDVSYYLKMNHSRLIVSNLVWRASLLRGLQSGFYEGLHKLYSNVIQTINNTRHYVRSEIKESVTGIWIEAEPYVQTYIEDMRALRMIEDDVESLKMFLNTSYHNNDFYIKSIVTVTMYTFDELALKKHFESVPAIVSEIWGIMGDSGKKIQKSIEWVIEKIKTYYKNITVFTRQLLDGDPIQHLSDIFSNMLEQYDDFIRKMHVAFIKYIEKLWHQTYDLIVDNWYKMLIAIEPTFLKLVAYTESIAWSTSQEFLDFLYIRKNELMESPYFAKFTNFTHDVDTFYREITGNNTLSSAVKYTKIGWNFFREKYMDKLPFAKEVEAIAREILGDLNELRKLPSISYIEGRLTLIYARLKWFYEYFEVEPRLQNFVTMLHKKVTDYSQTALQAENRYRKPKTKFIFDPIEGKMEWEQKLPMSWHAFNETPNFHEIPEIKAVYDVQNFFVTTHTTFWQFYYDYKPYTDPSEWLPPFKAQALLIGRENFVTFDRKYYEFEGKCSYLLATDMKDHNFTLMLSNGPGDEDHEIIMIVNKTKTVRINIFTDEVRLGDALHSKLPIEIGDTFIHRDFGLVTVESSSGYTLECNTKFHICTFEVSGWYFGKTAGLFGTINNEPSDDFTSSAKRKLKDVEQFAKSWSLNNECVESVKNKEMNSNQNSEIVQLCEDLYSNKVSQFSSCFERISKKHFLEMCLKSENLNEACSSAVAYTTLCSYENTPLTIPDSCIRCSLPNGSFINEGENVRFSGENIQQSADVVFLVESKECNANITASNNMRLLIESLNDELTARNSMDNRFAVVLFGGNGVYTEPRVRSLNGEIFTNSSSAFKTLENIPIGNGSADIFSALIYATRLNFRPAVSKTFILLPCSECHESSMKYDYPILHQLLTENAITLHILMNEDFNLQKMRENKIPYGIDSRRAFTKKDFRVLRGDEILRSHIKLPKTTMGLCMPLALETNGTLFVSKYLKSSKDEIVRKFVRIFTKRIAESSNQLNCMDCECTTLNNGISYMECIHCYNPSRGSMDYGFDEDEMLMNLQPSEALF